MRSVFVKKLTAKSGILSLAVLGAMAIMPAAQAAKNEVNLYSARKEKLIKPILQDFIKDTGIQVNLVTGKADALLKRIQTEGEYTPADVFITVDAGRLQRAKDAGVLQPVNSNILNQRVPAALRDKDNKWFGLSARSRIIVYNKSRVKPSELSTYEDLASPKWRGRICIRSSNNIYNQSLLASIIAHHGKDYALKWAKGVVANMARPPKGNDRAQMTAVAVGECDIGVVNTYYYGGWQKSKDPKVRGYAKKIALFYPNQSNRGTHINVSGAGVTKYAKNKANAVKLLEYLTNKNAQKFYAEVNHEFPVVKGTGISDTVKAWGYPFKADGLAINKLGEYNAEAVKIFDKAGWK